MTATARIAMWSGPRNISTAMMRAFENRADAEVWDEPLYAWYLRETGLDHPMADEIIAAYDSDWRTLIDKLLGPPPGGSAVFYQKHMTHHVLPGRPLDWLDGLTNCFLIRDPARVLASYADRRADVTLDDLGFPQQTRLFEHVRERAGGTPPILDADDVLADPRGMLMQLCTAVGIDFSEAMLSWPPGQRDSDGIWARHWYASVESSTGFAAAQQTPRPVPDRYLEIVEACRPHYAALYDLRLRPSGA